MTSQKDYRWVNIILASSNLTAIFFIDRHTNEIVGTMIYIFTMFCSILMHLSEVKHGLPGIHPFNRQSTELSYLDRIWLIVSISYGFIKLWYCGIICFHITKHYFGIALVCLFLSENIEPTKNKIFNLMFFCITRSLWHILGFYSFSFLINKIQ
jgi:hypothetical protein